MGNQLGLQRLALGVLAVAMVASWPACTATDDGDIDRRDDDDGGGGGADAGGVGTNVGGGLVGVGSGGGGPIIGDPKTCEEAALAESYIGCDFWPTVMPNAVWSIFDFAVVVANTGSNVVDIEVERNGSPVASAQIQPNSLQTVYLPWVQALKGGDADPFGSPPALNNSILAPGGAYHLTSSFPITVYQFSALQYAPQGGPPGKSWSACPADGIFTQCFSYSNDASLLMPSTAMTETYRVMGHVGLTGANIPGYTAVTATQDGTNVTLNLGPNGGILGGGGITPAGANGMTTVNLNAGDVAVFLADSDASDLSGSLVTADKPVQTMTGVSCVTIPNGQPACDHIEETVFPAETLGQNYVVTRPTGPAGQPVGHQVILYGNFDGTALTYPAGSPPGAPTSIGAGQVVDLGIVDVDFQVTGDNAFGVGSFQQGGSVVDAGGTAFEERGDPAHSMATAVEQYREKYVFLAPTDYDVNYVDIVRRASATLTLDGQTLSGPTTPLGEFVIQRITLTAATGGVHVLEGDTPFGIQVTGYGSYTSYYYPGGLNLGAIAPPPPK
ncbi:MAG: IgGFc-binding protein [Myxococcota bacterium]